MNREKDNSGFRDVFDIYQHREISLDWVEYMKELPPTMLEVVTANEEKLENYLYNLGCTIKWKPKQCQGGECCEIIEIQGPSASGFFLFKLRSLSLRFF